MNKDEEFDRLEAESDYIDNHIETIGGFDEHKKFMIVGVPKRVINNNLIFYKLPVRLIDENDNVENVVKYLSVTEEDLMDLMNIAKQMFCDEEKQSEVNKAYV